jgi:3-hydroxyacyl-CoA dehydrogenase
MHFFNPMPAMRLVEIRDLPGFVTTRLGTPLMREAMRAYEQGARGVRRGVHSPPVLRRMVEERKLGRNSCAGFHDD